MQRKLGKATDQRMALLKNQVSAFLWYGRLETTFARAKEVQKLAEQDITMAVRTYTDVVKVEKERIVDGKTVKVEVVNDGKDKLAVRRTLMAELNDLQEVPEFKEKKRDFERRTAGINHPLIEKIFNEYAPKYAQKAADGAKGGYTAIYKLGPRKGDAAEMAVIQLL